MKSLHRIGLLLVIFVCAVVLAAGPTAAGPIPNSKQIQKASKAFQKGQRALDAHNVDQARAAFEQALSIAPGFPQAELGLGHVAMSTGDFQGALDHYRKAKAGYAEYGKATQALETKRYTQTQRQIQTLQDSLNQLQMTSGRSRAVDADMKISQLENAISRLQAVEPPDPKKAAGPPAELDFYIGNALFRLGKLGEAISAWEACAEGNPKFAMVYNNLALGYWKKGDLEKAKKSLARAEELKFPVNPKFKAELEKSGGK